MFAWLAGILLIPAAPLARADDPAIAVSRVLGEGRAVVRLDGRDFAVRLVGVSYDAPTRALDDFLHGPADFAFESGQVIEADGTPLVELFRDGRSLNEEIVRLGLGRADPEAPARRRERLATLEAEARREGRGVWSPPEPDPEPAVQLASLPPAVPASTPAGATAPSPTAGPGPEPAAVPGGPSWAWIPGWLGEFVWPAAWSFAPLDLAGRAVFGVLGAWVARQRRRRRWEGLALGGLFGPFGVLIEALLPAEAVASPVSASAPGRAEPPPALDVAVPNHALEAPNPMIPRYLPPPASSVLWEGHSEELAMQAAWMSDDDQPVPPARGSESTESATHPSNVTLAPDVSRDDRRR